MPPSVSKPSVRRRPSSIARSPGSSASDRPQATQPPQPTQHPAPSSCGSTSTIPTRRTTPPPGVPRRARHDAPYDGEIAYADAQIARVLDVAATRTRLLDRTLVVVAGDHGEGLGDHGERTHGMLLYDSTLRVPLIVVGAGQRGRRRATKPVSLADIAPTMLRAAGVDGAGGDEGAGSAGARCGGAGADGTGTACGGEPDLYSETEYPRVAGWSPLQALTDGRWMTIRAGAASEVYDLQSDPREEHDVSAAQAVGRRGDGGAHRRDSRRRAAPAGARAISPDAAGAPALARLRRQLGAAGAGDGATAIRPRRSTRGTSSRTRSRR